MKKKINIPKPHFRAKYSRLWWLIFVLLGLVGGTWKVLLTQKISVEERAQIKRVENPLQEVQRPLTPREEVERICGPVNSEIFMDFALKGQSPSVIPDYSYAGYHRCEKPIPEVDIRLYREFNVNDYGANGKDELSDREAFVLAFKAAHAWEGPVVVKVPEGTFYLNEKEDLSKPYLAVTRSHFVIKGSGVAKTKLIFNEASPFISTSFMQFRSSSGNSDYWRGDRLLPGKIEQQIDIFSVKVSEVKGLAPGLRVNINATFEAMTSAANAYFSPHVVPEGIKGRNAGKINDIFEVHQIQSIEGSTVRFAEPIHLDLAAFSNLTLRSIDHAIEECGIEDLTMKGGYTHLFKHHSGPAIGEKYKMLDFNRVFNSWARRLRLEQFGVGMGFWLTGNLSISDILLEGNVGHCSITSNSSYGNLFAYIREYTDCHHGLGVARSSVNTVFLRCVQYKNLEAHCGFPRATLFDVNEGGFEPRGGGAKFTPHHDKGLTFWNWKATLASSHDFWPLGKPYGYFMPPVIAGLHGEVVQLKDAAQKVQALESLGKTVVPESLFEAQLALRLGGLPQWVQQHSGQFENLSRISRVHWLKPEPHALVVDSRGVELEWVWDKRLLSSDITSFELYVSRESQWRGYRKIKDLKFTNNPLFYLPNQNGFCAFKTRLINRLGEVSWSQPRVVHFGALPDVQPVGVKMASFLNGKDRQQLYQQFVQLGGGEGTPPQSPTLKNFKQDGTEHLLEQAYQKELAQVYKDFSVEMKKWVEDEKAQQKAAVFIDQDTNKASPEVYHYQESMLQVRFKEVSSLSRIEIHWKGKVPQNAVRLDVQTSLLAPDCLYSVVNDENIWQNSVARLGGTLNKEALPHQGGQMSQIFLPTEKVAAVRLLFTSFPNEMTEIKFYP